jgi:hypothetical protein
MHLRISHARPGARSIATLALAAVLTASGATAFAQSSASQAGLTGAWVVQVTLRDCASDAPLGSFNSLVTFHRGGTMHESPGNVSFAPGQRTDGHGRWAHEGGRTYLQRTIALIRFGSPANLPGQPGFDPTRPITPAFVAGWQIIEHTATLTGADSFTSAGTAAFYNAGGEVYSSGCSTAVGQRFK